MGYWDFAEEASQNRVSAGTHHAHQLIEANGSVERVTGGAALGGVLAAVWIPLPLLVFGGSLCVAGLGYLPFRKR